MSNYSDLLGLAYDEGKVDCYSLAREYYGRLWDIRLPNLARPTRFYEDTQFDLYGRYAMAGFQPVLDQKLKIGDGLLMPIFTQFNSHVAILVEDNLILHHFPGQLSRTEAFRPKWANRVTMVLRHPKVTQIVETKHLHEVMGHVELFRDPRFQAAAARAMEQGSGTVRNDPGSPDH